MESPPRVPQVRAKHTQTLLRLAEERAPAGGPSVAAALGAETRAALEAADPSSWIPIEIDVEVVEVITERLGLAAMASIVDANVREETESTLLSGLAKTVLEVFGVSPVIIVKQIPAGWRRIFRNAGWVEIVSTGRSDAVVRFHRLPARCVGSPAWIESVLVGLRSFYDLAGVKGTVECWIEDAAEGTALITFRWK